MIRSPSVDGPGGLAGLPTSDELAVPGGRVSRFQKADLYALPGIGVFEVHGAIRAKYNALGGASSFLGLPITDEVTRRLLSWLFTSSPVLTGRTLSYRSGAPLLSRTAGTFHPELPGRLGDGTLLPGEQSGEDFVGLGVVHEAELPERRQLDGAAGQLADRQELVDELEHADAVGVLELIVGESVRFLPRCGGVAAFKRSGGTEVESRVVADESLVAEEPHKHGGAMAALASRALRHDPAIMLAAIDPLTSSASSSGRPDGSTLANVV